MAKLARRVRRMLRDETGAVAVTLTLSLVPLTMMAIGAADLTHALSARNQLQDALDAATLSAARTAPLSKADLLQTAGATAFQRNLGTVPSDVHPGAPAFAANKGTVTGDVSEQIDTIILGLFTGNKINVKAHSEVVSGNLKLEIALVLDNSGSMGQNGKINDLKTAATNFVTTMETAANQWGDTSAVQISLVPFSQTVRVDPSNANAPWLDVNGNAKYSRDIFGMSGVNRIQYFQKLGASWAGCLENRAYPYSVSDRSGDPAVPDTLWAPYFWPDEYDYREMAYPYNTYRTQNQYLDDGLTSSTDWLGRERNTAKYVKTYGLSAASGPNMWCDMQPIRPLSTNFDALRAAIAGMTPTHDTNIPMGLAWGWQTIVPGGPLPPTSGIPVSQYGDKLHRKIAVVMTDGYNQFTGVPSDPKNKTFYEADGYVWEGRLTQANGAKLTGGTDDDRTAALDRRLAELCVNMKAKGIEIYTVSVGVEPAHLEPLHSCASGEDHAFDVSNGAQMIDAFDSIARQIASLRISR